MDSRTPLIPQKEIWLYNENGEACSWVIREIICYGRNCIVYRGLVSDGRQPAHTQIIKEFYPPDLRIMRDGNALVVPEEVREEFARRETEFTEGISVYAAYYEQTDKCPFFCGKANGTAYAVLNLSQGETLRAIDRGALSLCGICKIMSSLCSAIQKFHDHGLLYLGCSPDAIFLRQVNYRQHVQLIDFDTAAALHEIKNGGCTYAARSTDWTPGEQRNWQAEKVGRQTDIYSVGAVLFYLLAGYAPKHCDIQQIEEGRFHWQKWSSILRDCPDAVISLVQDIAVHTLRDEPASRYENIALLKKDFQDLYAAVKKESGENEEILSAIADGLASVRQALAKQTEFLSAERLNSVYFEEIGFKINQALRDALLREQKNLEQSKERYFISEKAYLEKPSPFAEEQLHIAKTALKRQQEKLALLQKDISDNYTLVMKHLSMNDLDDREKRALEAVKEGNYTDANGILRDPAWKSSVEDLNTMLENAKICCRQYISGQKLLISNLRALGINNTSKKEISRIYEEIIELAEKHQTEYSVFYDYADFLRLQRDYQRGINFAERLEAHYTLLNEVSDVEKIKLYVLLGELYYWVQNYTKAFDLYSRAISLDNSDSRQYETELMRLYVDKGNLFWRQSLYSDAEESLDKALSLWESMDQQNPEHAKMLAEAYNCKATILNKARRLDDAEKYHLKALKLREELHRQYPTDDSIQSDLSVTHSNLGIVYRRMGKYIEAEKHYYKSYQIRDDGRMRNKTLFESGFAITCSNYAFLLAIIGRLDEAERMIVDEALPAKASVRERLPQSYEKTYAITLDDYGFILTRSSDPEKWKLAADKFQEAIEIKSRLADKDHLAHDDSLAISHFHYAQLLRKTGPLEDAEAKYREALETWKKLEEQSPGYFEFEIAEVSEELADFLCESGRALEDVEGLYTQARDFYKRLKKKSPSYYLQKYYEIKRKIKPFSGERSSGHEERQLAWNNDFQP